MPLMVKLIKLGKREEPKEKRIIIWIMSCPLAFSLMALP